MPRASCTTRPRSQDGRPSGICRLVKTERAVLGFSVKGVHVGALRLDADTHHANSEEGRYPTGKRGTSGNRLSRSGSRGILPIRGRIDNVVIGQFRIEKAEAIMVLGRAYSAHPPVRDAGHPPLRYLLLPRPRTVAPKTFSPRSGPRGSVPGQRRSLRFPETAADGSWLRGKQIRLGPIDRKGLRNRSLGRQPRLRGRSPRDWIPIP